MRSAFLPGLAPDPQGADTAVAAVRALLDLQRDPSALGQAEADLGPLRREPAEARLDPVASAGGAGLVLAPVLGLVAEAVTVGVALDLRLHEELAAAVAGRAARALAEGERRSELVAVLTAVGVVGRAVRVAFSATCTPFLTDTRAGYSSTLPVPWKVTDGPTAARLATAVLPLPVPCSRMFEKANCTLSGVNERARTFTTTPLYGAGEGTLSPFGGVGCL